MSALSESRVSILCVDHKTGVGNTTANTIRQYLPQTTVETVTTFREALKHVAENNVDCIISEYNIHGRDGVVLLEAIRSAYPDLPFIFFTDTGSEEIASQVVSIGATDYVQKASRSDVYRDLANAVQNAVDGFNRRDSLNAPSRTDGGGAIKHGPASVDTQSRASRLGSHPPTEIQAKLNNAPDAVLCVDTGTVTYANTEATQLFRTPSVDHIQGKPLRVVGGEKTSPQNAAENTGSLTETASTIAQTNHIVTTSTQRIQTFDGDLRTVFLTAWQVGWQTDSCVFISLTELDARSGVSPQTEFQTAFENALDSMIVIDSESRIVYANEMASTLLGVDRHELFEKSLVDFITDSGIVEDTDLFATEKTDPVTFTVQRPDGQKRVIEYAVSTTSQSNQYVAILHDITDRVHAQKQIETDRDVLAELNSVSSQTDISTEKKLSELLSLGVEYLELDVGVITSPTDERQFIIAEDSPYNELSRGKIVDIELPSTCLSSGPGNIYTVTDDTTEEHAEPITTPGEMPDMHSCIGTGIDVAGGVNGHLFFSSTRAQPNSFTRREKTFIGLLANWVSYELERKQTIIELQKKSNRFDDFAALVSHDMRNPLSVAVGYADLVEKEGTVEQFDQLQTSLDRLKRLVDDLVYLSQDGGTIDTIETVDLDAAIIDAWETTTGPSSSGEINIHGELGTIKADHSRLLQAFENLFDNALTYAGTAVNVTVEPITAEEADIPHTDLGVPPNTLHGIKISDDGPGVPESIRTDVFERGYTTNEEGSGLGLSIVNTIITEHGWKISATDSSDGGAQFRITGFSTEKKTIDPDHDLEELLSR